MIPQACMSFCSACSIRHHYAASQLLTTQNVGPFCVVLEVPEVLWIYHASNRNDVIVSCQNTTHFLYLGDVITHFFQLSESQLTCLGRPTALFDGWCSSRNEVDGGIVKITQWEGREACRDMKSCTLVNFYRSVGGAVFKAGKDILLYLLLFTAYVQ